MRETDETGFAASTFWQPSGLTRLNPSVHTRIHTLSAGTFITEWDAGTEKCRHVFESEEMVARCVEQMVALAVHHGFEGTCIF